jgi:hypothetical protein
MSSLKKHVGEPRSWSRSILTTPSIKVYMSSLFLELNYFKLPSSLRKNITIFMEPNRFDENIFYHESNDTNFMA